VDVGRGGGEIGGNARKWRVPGWRPPFGRSVCGAKHGWGGKWKNCHLEFGRRSGSQSKASPPGLRQQDWCRRMPAMRYSLQSMRHQPLAARLASRGEARSAASARHDSRRMRGNSGSESGKLIAFPFWDHGVYRIWGGVSGGEARAMFDGQTMARGAFPTPCDPHSLYSASANGVTRRCHARAMGRRHASVAGAFLIVGFLMW
jgi:hypothetical protein